MIDEDLKKFIKTFINDAEFKVKSFKVVKNGVEMVYTRENENDKFRINKEQS